MHRVLLIQAGQAFDDLVASLHTEQARRRGVVGGREVGLRVVAASAALPDDRQSGEFDAALAELFRLRGAPGEGELLLDLVVLVDLGEPEAARAAARGLEVVVELLDDRYDAIFPAHRRGAARRVRGYVFALLPADDECAPGVGREGAQQASRELHGELMQRRQMSEQAGEQSDGDEAGVRQWPADRLFLLDAVTTRGIATRGDLVDQVGLLLRALIFAGLRRHPMMVNLLEAPGRDLIASFGCAGLVLDRHALHERLTARYAWSLAAALTADADLALPPWGEVVSAAALRDGGALERALRAVEATAATALEVDGPGALPPLIRHHEALLERLGRWDPADLLAEALPAEAAPVSQAGTGRLPLVVGLAAALGLGVFALARLALDLDAATSAGVGAGFAVLGAVVLAGLVRRRPAVADEGWRESSSERAEEEAAMAGRLDALRAAAQAQRDGLSGLRARLESTRDALARVPTAPTGGIEGFGRIFVTPFAGDGLADVVYRRALPYANEADAAAAFVASRGGWKALLDDAAQADAHAVRAFSREALAPALHAEIFADPDAQRAARPAIEAFIHRWRAGVPLALEWESRKHRDPDGVRLVFEQCIIAPAALQPLLAEGIEAAGSCARLGPAAEGLDDVLLLHACTDIHHEATSPLTSRSA